MKNKSSSSSSSPHQDSGSSPKSSSGLAINVTPPINVFNPENIKAGDLVQLAEGDEELGPMKVITVSGTNNNKVYCEEIGHELYANCFKKIS